LRRALQHIAAARSNGDVWMTTPGAIARHMDEMESAGLVSAPHPAHLPAEK